MNRFVRLAVFAMMMIPVPAAMAARVADNGGVESIAAVVNSDAITASELAARMRLMIASSGLPNTPEVIEKMKPQITNTLIDERIMLQEAKRDNIKISPAEIEQGYATIAGQNSMTAEQFKAMLAKDGIPAGTLGSQIEAQIAWGQVVQKKIRPQISIADSEVYAAIDRLKGDIGKTQYLVADIFLPVSSPQEDGNVRQLATRMAAEISAGHAPFQRVAMQFSQAPGASRGGDMGWIQQGQLAPELDQALAALNENQVSPPVRSEDGYHILLLRRKTTVTEKDIPGTEAMLDKMGMEKLDRAQRRYLMQLRNAAFIERRA